MEKQGVYHTLVTMQVTYAHINTWHTIQHRQKGWSLTLFISVVSLSTADLSGSWRWGGARLWAVCWWKEPIGQVLLSVLSVQEKIHKRILICCLRGKERWERKVSGWPGQNRRGELCGKIAVVWVAGLKLQVSEVKKIKKSFVKRICFLFPLHAFYKLSLATEQAPKIIRQGNDFWYDWFCFPHPFKSLVPIYIAWMMLLYVSHLTSVQTDSFRSISSTSHYDGRWIRTFSFPALLLSLQPNHFIAMTGL